MRYLIVIIALLVLGCGSVDSNKNTPKSPEAKNSSKTPPSVPTI